VPTSSVLVLEMNTASSEPPLRIKCNASEVSTLTSATALNVSAQQHLPGFKPAGFNLKPKSIMSPLHLNIVSLLVLA
jgi:hypothetical protein